jgi:hypothetical protein
MEVPMKIEINFKSITIKSFKNSQDKPNIRQLFAEINFDAIVNNNKYKDINIPVNQTFGERSIGGEIEVGSIKSNYNFAWNHDQFIDKIKEYYKMCIGPNGRFLNTKGSKNLDLTMINCTMGIMHTTKIEAGQR